MRYKVDVLSELKKAGYNTNRLRKERVFSEAVIQSFREYKPISWKILEKLCELLDCEPGDIIAR